MTDKQIIIGGVDVSGCDFLNKTRHCKAQMSIMGTDTNKCKCFPNCYYKQLKAKEQECEELKKWKENVINIFDKTCRCKYLNEESTYCSFYNKECIAINQCLYKNQQTLTEIKEIAEEEVHTRMLFADKKSFCDFNKILQKISEVENERN